MRTLEAKIATLEQILLSINNNLYNEAAFEKLYQLLQSEYNIERKNDSVIDRGSYADNLLQTIEKQANSYRSAKNKSKSLPQLYREFTYNYEQDISEELYRCKVRFNPPTGQ